MIGDWTGRTNKGIRFSISVWWQGSRGPFRSIFPALPYYPAPTSFNYKRNVRARFRVFISRRGRSANRAETNQRGPPFMRAFHYLDQRVRINRVQEGIAWLDEVSRKGQTFGEWTTRLGRRRINRLCPISSISFTFPFPFPFFFLLFSSLLPSFKNVRR